MRRGRITSAELFAGDLWTRYVKGARTGTRGRRMDETPVNGPPATCSLTIEGLRVMQGTLRLP